MKYSLHIDTDCRTIEIFKISEGTVIGKVPNIAIHHFHFRGVHPEIEKVSPIFD